jgi:hypothetical protein
VVHAASFHIRLATPADVPALHALIDLSVRTLQAHDFSPAQIEGALGTVFGVDTQLIADGTYFVLEAMHGGEQKIAANPRRAHSEWTKKARIFAFPAGSMVAAKESLALAPTIEVPLANGASLPVIRMSKKSLLGRLDP